MGVLQAAAMKHCSSAAISPIATRMTIFARIGPSLNVTGRLRMTATSTSSTAGRDVAPRHVVAVVAFDGISPFHLSVPCVVFGEDRSNGGLPDFDFRVCASEPGALTTTAGFSIAVTHGLEALADAHTIIVPSWRDPNE